MFGHVVGRRRYAPTTSPHPARTWRPRAGGVPVLVVRDDDGALRAFLNVCRHRGSPLADGCGHAPRAVVPVPRLGVPARRVAGAAGGVGEPDGFDAADFGLRPIAGHDVRPLDPRQPRRRRGAVRPRSAGRRRSIRTGSTSSSSASATAYELRASTGRCCSRTTARTTTRRSSTRSCRRRATSTRSRREGQWCSPGIARSRPVTRPSGRCTTTGRATPGWAAVADVAAPESFNNGSLPRRCSRTPRSRASPASPRRSG